MTSIIAKRLSVYRHRNILFPPTRPSDSLLHSYAKWYSSRPKIYRPALSGHPWTHCLHDSLIRSWFSPNLRPPCRPVLPAEIVHSHHQFVHQQCRRSSSPMVYHTSLCMRDLRSKLDKFDLSSSNTETGTRKSHQERLAWRVEAK